MEVGTDGSIRLGQCLDRVDEGQPGPVVPDPTDEGRTDVERVVGAARKEVVAEVTINAVVGAQCAVAGEGHESAERSWDGHIGCAVSNLDDAPPESDEVASAAGRSGRGGTAGQHDREGGGREKGTAPRCGYPAIRSAPLVTYRGFSFRDFAPGQGCRWH